MTYRLEVAPSVIKEARKIYLFRERDRKSSGERFIYALVECYSRVKKSPYGCQVRKDPFRYAMFHRLKYRLVYKVEGDVVSIVQLRHMSRKPTKKFGP